MKLWSRATACLAAIGIAVTAAASVQGGRQRERLLSFGRSDEPDYGNVAYDGRLTFVRVRYTVGLGGYGRRGSRGEVAWAHDYPTADIHMMKILDELTSASPRIDGSNVLSLDDPELFDYPIAYMSEPGFWTMNEEEVTGLRNYLLKGGFMIFDDFRGPPYQDWDNLQEQMQRVLPEHRFVLLDQTNTIFNCFFEIQRFDFGMYGPETYYGVFEDNDPRKRLMAVAGVNQDLGEFWEYSDTGMLPVDQSNEAYKFGVNYFMYALTH
jgi:hypothetical protein